MLVIGIQNTKGGATKSTTSVNLARAYQKMNMVVALGETDPQGTLKEWYADNDAEGNNQAQVIQLLDKSEILGVRDNPALQNCDVLIIDGVANGFKEFLAVSKVADLVLIVSQPSPADIKPVDDLMDILDGRDTRAAFLLTRTRKGDDLAKQVRAALSEYGYPVLRNTIRDLKGFKTTFGVGQTVFEYNDYKHAQEDVLLVAQEIITLMEEEG